MLFIILTFVSCKEEHKKELKSNSSKKIEIENTKAKNNINKDSLNHKNTVVYFAEYGKQHLETKVVFKTRLGNIVIKLYKDTPLHRASFIFLTKKGYFDTTCFHRVVKGFIAQGGNSENRKTSNFRNKYKNYKLPAEFRKNRKHKRGIIAIARDWEDNLTKESTPFEFYFTVNKRGEHHLNNEHTVFGEVIKGMNVVDEITKLKVGKDDWPYEDVFIDAEVLVE